MFFRSLLTLCVAIIVVQSVDTSKILPTYKQFSESISERLEDSKVLPEYLGSWKPLGSFIIKYKDSENLELGNYLSPNQTENPPTEFTFKSFFTLTKQFKSDLYSIALTDLDPDYEKAHAIWENIPFNDEDFTIVENQKDNDTFDTTFNLTNSRNLLEYLGPGPRPGTGTHRYVYILFRQPYGKLPNHELKFRERWGSKYLEHGVEDWANYYGLEPLAVNFFTSSNEDDGN
ncbi:Phosphatidylethanolamine-binding protein [Wickerhamomyces ciferrii]|uniref:Phosphatidylethanolamine-binding protein n=1 Tax=Wickerhamomyces ciferrii (strain ATCC 14091 / BCRC 22168 / CBS 111 / JCM 3599 / NBRC 0793 / NRRL Y-1031 F-60-10) TaxID=1206466 RepID=K0KVN9_WICCF|nr:Phosphatidylethanolamine-binding protein [Wickerhamomyces ciferrii]CCH46017.1 Phosphatidylethanolamine-binding protein [Wickerhamomyces ciferrii]